VLVIEHRRFHVTVEEAKLTGLAVDTPILSVNTIRVTHVGPTVISVKYELMPDNLPSTYGNFLAIWQNTRVPWDNAPLKTQPITTNSQHGTASFSGFTVTSNPYVVGLSVGPVRQDTQKYANVCATASVNPTGNDFQSSLTALDIGANSLTFEYRLPPGCRPLTNGAWLGLWTGTTASYTTPPDVKNGIVQTDVNQPSASISFNNLELGTGAEYTVGLFTTGWNSDPTKLVSRALGAALTFVVP
jgi:hypothetical protein